MMVKDCNFCICNKVCGIKFTIKNAVELYKGVNLTVWCDEFTPAMDKPEETTEVPIADTPAVENVTKKRTGRGKSKR